jgi:hypothetical protein
MSLLDKQVSWAQVLADVLAQQVKLMGPKNLKVCLSGYLAPIYSAKKVLTQREAQDYRYTIQGGDLDAKEAKEEEEESATETESDPETDPEPTPETSSEEQEVEPPSGDQAKEEPTGSPPPEKLEVENQTGSEEKGQEAEQSQSPAHSTPDEPAAGQEAQGESTPDPNLSLDAGWQMLQAQGQRLMNRLGLEITPAQRAGFISDLAGVLQQELTSRDRDWEKMGKLLNCFPTPTSISTGVIKVGQEKEGLANWIQELEEKRISLEKDYREAEHELAYRKSEVGLLLQHVDKIRRERNDLQGVSQQQQQQEEQLAKELKSVRETLTLDKGVQKSLQVATEAAKIILEVDKEVIIQKQLQVLYKEEAQPFPRLYKLMQDFITDIMQVQEGLEREFGAIQQYLKEKHRPAIEASQKEDQKVEGKEEVIEVHSSDLEGEWPEGVQTLGLSRGTKKAPEGQPDLDKQVVPFQPSEEKSEPETGRLHRSARPTGKGAAANGGADPQELPGQVSRYIATRPDEYGIQKSGLPGYTYSQ